MQAITILDKAKQAQDPVTIPRKEYEALIHGKKPQTSPIIIKRSPSFRVAKKHEKFYDELDKELTETLRDMKAGNVHGPFETVEEVRHSLES